MKAIAVYPGKPNSMHLEEIPMPNVTDIPNGCGVLVKVSGYDQAGNLCRSNSTATGTQHLRSDWPPGHDHR